jgi:hypothetical protein
MNRITRMLTITGLGLVTGVAIGAGPAMASPSVGQGAAKSDATATSAWRGDRVVGFFPSFRSCIRAGEYGEDRGWWDDSYCRPTGNGRVALIVDEDDWGTGWSGNWGGNWVGTWWPGTWHGGGWGHGGWGHGGWGHGGWGHGGGWGHRGGDDSKR